MAAILIDNEAKLTSEIGNSERSMRTITEVHYQQVMNKY